MLDHFVGTGTDRLGIHAGRADFLVVLGRMHHRRGRQVLLRRGKWLLADDPHFVLVYLFDTIDPGHIGLGRRVVLGIRDKGQRVDHRVRVKLLTVVEFDPLAQFKLDRSVINLFETLGKLAFVLTRDRVPKQQRIPDVRP